MRPQTHRHTPIYLGIILCTAALLTLSATIPASHNDTQLLQPHHHPPTLDITWDAQISLTETGGRSDAVWFGEAPDATDGPPADTYDVAKAPPPLPPYLRAWLADGLPTPYDYLWKDYRSYPDTSKTWNLTVHWVPDTILPTTVTLTWDTSILNATEYDTVLLWNTTGVVANMRTTHTYTFACPAFLPQAFTIVATADTTPPHITNHSPASGHTGDNYTFQATITDDQTASSQITASVNWVHGSHSGNTTMTYLGGNNFTATVTLDNYSVNPLSYRFYACDTAKNPNANYTAPYTATVTDDEPPIITGHSSNIGTGTGDSITLWAAGTDNIGITSATATIDATGHAMTYNSGQLRWEYVYIAPTNSTASHPYSLLVSDAAANTAVTSTYTITVTDDDPPEITTDAGAISVGTGDTVTLWAKATDNIAVTSAKATVDGIDHPMTWNGGQLRWEYLYTAPTSNLTSHTYTLTVSDAAGNTHTHGPYTITVFDNDPPEITGTSAALSVGTGDTTVLWLTATDNIAVTAAKATVDGSDVAMTWNTGFNRWQCSYTAPANSTASHSYTATAADAAGNTHTHGPYTITVFDNDPPEITSDSNAVSVGTGDTVTLWVKATDNIAVTSAKATIDSTDHPMTWNNGPLRWEYLYTAPTGSVLAHSYTLTVSDAALNSHTHGPYTITVFDNDPPEISAVSATPTAQLINNTVNVSAIITDNINLQTCKVRINGPAGYTAINASMSPAGGNTYTYAVTPSLTGTYNYSIWAQDTSGNAATSTIHQFTMYRELSLTTVSAGWNTITLPFNQTISKTDLFVIYQGQRYTWSQAAAASIVMDTLFAWSRTTQGYSVAPTLAPGNGYWLYAYHDCDILATNLNPHTQTTQITSLSFRWNIIGVPCNNTVDKTTFIVTYQGVDYNWTRATTNDNPTRAPLIMKEIFGWNRGTQTYVLTTVFDPGTGAWLYAYHDCLLKRQL